MAYRSREEQKDQREVKREKKCRICIKSDTVDYKDVQSLSRFMNDRGKILPRRVTGLCAKHQKLVSEGIKTARQMSLLSNIDENIR
ncbi:MAG: 30S ribosomal protein S18 [bacterium]